MDTESLIAFLNENKVKYLVIGAAAFPPHGYSRATLDIDIFIEKTRENAERTHNALKAFGYDVTDISVDDIMNNKILIRQYMLETDIHPFVKGANFKDAWENKVKDKIGAQDVFFASLDDLIKMKEAAGRPKDLEDLKVLYKIKNRKKT